MIVLLQDTISESNRENEDLIRKSKAHLNIAYEVLESHTNTVKASVQDLDQKNKDLQDSNTSLSKENTKLFASIYNLNRNRSSLRSLFARSDRHASDLEAKLAYVQEISAANAQKATLSATALQNAGSKTTTLKEQIDYYKDLISSNDSLQRLAIDETQDQLFRLSALEEDRLQLEWQNTDIELQEQAITRVAKAKNLQEEVT
ncbi:hypothetical protein N0V91_004416 [Didymella pomorum]|uniref:Uncharacterized protein n=1 Tax=Didymella pomorum TaxID=749634 RepID=A0A9W9D9A6_9PLEO|nr:hypothetical protein N0V91_004416 [Didymella pomorum]